MKQKTNLATNLRILRNHKKYSQQRISDILNIPRPRYERWEAGNEPPLIMLLEIAKHYEVLIDALLTELPSHKKTISNEL